MTPANKSSRKSKPKKDRGSGSQASASAPSDLQWQYVNAYMDYLKGVEQGQASLQLNYAEAYNAYEKAVHESQQEFHQSGVEAYRTYAASLQAISGENETYSRCADAYQSYLNSLHQMVKGWREAEQREYEAYQEYTRALQDGQDEQEIQELAEKVQQAHMDALQIASNQDELRQDAAEAQATYTQLLQEAQEFGQNAAEDAYRTYLKNLQTIVEQSNVEKSCLAAAERYQHKLQEITYNAQAKTMEAEIKALNTLRTAWQAFGNAATD